MTDEILRNLNLSDIQVVGLLLAYRDKYDPYNPESLGTNVLEVKGAIPLRQQIIDTYAVLDQLIERCQFDDIQKTIIRMSGNGHSTYEIGKAVGIPQNVVQGRFNTICRYIVKENLRQWRKTTFVKNLGLKTKRCTKCLENLPATPEFFTTLNHSNDGFHSQCKKCKG